MHIWVDADACPAVIKDILFRAAQRWQVPLTLVANQALYTPPSPLIRAVQVPRGFDVADAHIVERADKGDLVITGDIPLAAQVLEKGAMALNPRGERYSPETIRERLAVRDMMEELRASGVDTGGPPTFSQADRKAFANQLDTLLARVAREMRQAAPKG
ncbi:YaiI/YqxD family protein [Achromobacter deleyi]|uniref:YaiI/YqxD family protein n=1 Tax=Achromobacter deleyi TaxID=1353891 RepID=UPI001492A1B9|nr:YaiI/YqxD family protein [Achromobacter deleyi]QVQ24824.1 YaiI/YqxD family protein [Achromobacter deleyi]UIP20364.1 YaiI/YqxD family protein [Achromobacter deleyi]